VLLRSRLFVVAFLVVAVLAASLAPVPASPAGAAGRGVQQSPSGGGGDEPRAEPWPGGQVEADPSEGQAEYRIDDATGEVVWPGDDDVEGLEVPSPDELQELESVEVDPLDEPRDPTVPEGFVPGESTYVAELSTDRVHVWANPDGSRTVKYGTRPFEVDVGTGQAAVAVPELEPGGAGFEGRAGGHTIEVPGETSSDPGDVAGRPGSGGGVAVPEVVSVTIDGGDRFGLGFEAQEAVPVLLDERERPGGGAPERVAVAEAVVGGADAEIAGLSQGVKVDLVAETPEEASGLVEVLSVPAGWSMRQGPGVIELIDPAGRVDGVWAGGDGYDSAEEPVTTFVGLELVEFADGVGRARLVVDEGWLDDPGRVFPVVLDPTVAVGVLADTRIEDGDRSGSNYAAAPELSVGISNDGFTSRSLLKFDDPVYGTDTPAVLEASEFFSLETSGGLTDGFRVTRAELEVYYRALTRSGSL
jgi:hypothetical protein